MRAAPVPSGAPRLHGAVAIVRYGLAAEPPAHCRLASERPIGFNPLSAVPVDLKPIVADGVVSAFFILMGPIACIVLLKPTRETNKLAIPMRDSIPLEECLLYRGVPEGVRTSVRNG